MQRRFSYCISSKCFATRFDKQFQAGCLWMARWFHIQFAAIFAQRVMFLASFKNTTFSILPSVESVLRYLRWSCLLMGKSMSGWCYCSRLSLSFVNATSLERACTSQTMIPNLLYQHRQCNTPGKYFRQVLILVDRPLKIAWTWKFRWSINITRCFAVRFFLFLSPSFFANDD